MINTQRLYNKLKDPKYYLMYYCIYVLFNCILMIGYENTVSDYINNIGDALNYLRRPEELLIAFFAEPIVGLIDWDTRFPIILGNIIIITLIIGALYRFKTDKKKKYIFQWIIFIFILLFRLFMLTIFSLAMTVPQF